MSRKSSSFYWKYFEFWPKNYSQFTKGDIFLESYSEVLNLSIASILGLYLDSLYPSVKVLPSDSLSFLTDAPI